MVRIVQVKSESVRVDGNHPLAGRVVTLEVRLISVDSSADANGSKPQFDVGGES
jgi:FKBP-type peptidyl-prolyl cis-trans isomerase 2